MQDRAPVAVESYEASLLAGHDAIERFMGPFQGCVRVHAWEGGVAMESGNHGEIRHGGEGLHEEIPGIGPARVRAFHTSSASGLFGTSGVFVGTPDCGTVVHELVHARFAEEEARIPLWFEEGFATLLGDGILQRGEWIVDGLAAWPWRELRDGAIDEKEFRRLLKIRPDAEHSVRENVLLHFVGWAVVFDLYREVGVLDWRALLERFRSAPDPVDEARQRMARTLDPRTPFDWLDSRRDAAPGPRLAAFKGIWKLHAPEIAERMLGELDLERDPEVRAALAVNVIATAGHVMLPTGLQTRMWHSILPTLRDAELPVPSERAALRALYRAYHYGGGKSAAQSALEELARFWDE